MFASRFSWLMVAKEERRFTGRARVPVVIMTTAAIAKRGACFSLALVTAGGRESADILPGNVETVLDCAETVPENVEIVPESAEMVAGSVEIVPGSVEMVPGGAEIVPDIADIMPDSVEIRPESVEIPASAKSTPTR